jgi:hypothetical protein
MPSALAPTAPAGAVQVVVRNTFVECWTPAREEEYRAQTCPASCVGRCFSRVGAGDDDGSLLGGDVDDGPKAGSSRATTYSYTGSDTGDVDIISSGSGDDEIEGWHGAAEPPPSFPSTPAANFLAIVPTLQFTSPFGNHTLPVAVGVANSYGQVDVAMSSSDAERTPLEGSDSMPAERPVVVLRLSNVLADTSQPFAAAPPCMGIAPPPSHPAPLLAPPPAFAPPSVEPSAPPLPPPVHAPGTLPEPEGVAEPPSSEPLVLSRSASPELPSMGSEGHAMGRCKPCAFFHKEGCQNEDACKFCHLCEPGEKRKRQKERRDQKEQKIAARKMRQAAK